MGIPKQGFKSIPQLMERELREEGGGISKHNFLFTEISCEHFAGKPTYLVNMTNIIIKENKHFLRVIFVTHPGLLGARYVRALQCESN